MRLTEYRRGILRRVDNEVECASRRQLLQSSSQDSALLKGTEVLHRPEFHVPAADFECGVGSSKGQLIDGPRSTALSRLLLAGPYVAIQKLVRPPLELLTSPLLQKRKRVLLSPLQHSRLNSAAGRLSSTFLPFSRSLPFSFPSWQAYSSTAWATPKLHGYRLIVLPCVFSSLNHEEKHISSHSAR